MSLRSQLACSLALALLLGFGCTHAAPPADQPKPGVAQKTAPAQPRAKTRYDIASDEVMFEIELLALPSAEYARFSFALRKQIEDGEPVSQAVLDGFMSNSQTKALMSPRCKTKYGMLGGDTSEVYYPDGAPSGRAMPGTLELTTAAIDILPLRQLKGIKIYSVLNLVSKGQMANVHAAFERIVHPDTGQYMVYKMKSRDGAWDYFMFMKVLTKNE